MSSIDLVKRRREPNPHVGKVVEVQFDDHRWYEYSVRAYDSIREQYTVVYSEGQLDETDQVVKLDFDGMLFGSKRRMRVKRPRTSAGRASAGEQSLKRARTCPPPSPPLANLPTPALGQREPNTRPNRGRREPPVCSVLPANESDRALCSCAQTTVSLAIAMEMRLAYKTVMQTLRLRHSVLCTLAAHALAADTHSAHSLLTLTACTGCTRSVHALAAPTHCTHPMHSLHSRHSLHATAGDGGHQVQRGNSHVRLRRPEREQNGTGAL